MNNKPHSCRRKWPWPTGSSKPAFAWTNWGAPLRTRYDAWDFNPGPSRHEAAHLRVSLSARCPQQSATDADSTSTTHRILRPPAHFCPSRTPALNCVLQVAVLSVSAAAFTFYVSSGVSVEDCEYGRLWCDTVRLGLHGTTAVRREARLHLSIALPSNGISSKRVKRTHDTKLCDCSNTLGIASHLTHVLQHPQYAHA